MTSDYEKLALAARALSSSEKAALARTLLDEIDPAVDEHVERLWVEEAQRRYDAYQSGTLAAISGEAAMQQARRTLG